MLVPSFHRLQAYRPRYQGPILHPTIKPQGRVVKPEPWPWHEVPEDPSVALLCYDSGIAIYLHRTGNAFCILNSTILGIINQLCAGQHP